MNRYKCPYCGSVTESDIIPCCCEEIHGVQIPDDYSQIFKEVYESQVSKFKIRNKNIIVGVEKIEYTKEALTVTFDWIIGLLGDIIFTGGMVIEEQFTTCGDIIFICENGVLEEGTNRELPDAFVSSQEIVEEIKQMCRELFDNFVKKYEEYEDTITKMQEEQARDDEIDRYIDALREEKE